MIEEFSRPATLDDLRALIRALNEHDVDYLLIGGYALFIHGYHRSTTSTCSFRPRRSLVARCAKP